MIVQLVVLAETVVATAEEFYASSGDIVLGRSISLKLQQRALSRFSGVLDGAGLEISGYTWTAPLITICSNCVVKNVVFRDLSIHGGYAGLINSSRNATFQNVSLTNSDFVGSVGAASFALFASSTLNFENCTVNAYVEGAQQGGLFLSSSFAVSVRNTWVSVQMTAGNGLGKDAVQLEVQNSQIGVQVTPQAQHNLVVSALFEDKQQLRVNNSAIRFECATCLSVLLFSSAANVNHSYVNATLLAHDTAGTLTGTLVNEANSFNYSFLSVPAASMVAFPSKATCAYVLSAASVQGQTSNIRATKIEEIAALIADCSEFYQEDAAKLFFPLDFSLAPAVKCQTFDCKCGELESGSRCGSCVLYRDSTTGLCTRRIPVEESHGLCEINAQNQTACTSCSTGYKLSPSADKCLVDNCLKTCNTCELSPDNTMWNCGCADGKDPAAACASCATGYFAYGGACRKRVLGRHGDCFLAEGQVECLSCTAGFQLAGKSSTCAKKPGVAVIVILAAGAFVVVLFVIVAVVVARLCKRHRSAKFLAYKPTEVKSDAVWQGKPFSPSRMKDIKTMLI